MKNKSKENKNCCTSCKHFVQFYVAKKDGSVYAVGYAYCDKFHMVIHNFETNCDKFEKGQQEFIHSQRMDCFYELQRFKNKFKELKEFFDNMKA